jgi:hypothetical protein
MAREQKEMKELEGCTFAPVIHTKKRGDEGEPEEIRDIN